MPWWYFASHIQVAQRLEIQAKEYSDSFLMKNSSLFRIEGCFTITHLAAPEVVSVRLATNNNKEEQKIAKASFHNLFVKIQKYLDKASFSSSINWATNNFAFSSIELKVRSNASAKSNSNASLNSGTILELKDKNKIVSTS